METALTEAVKMLRSRASSGARKETKFQVDPGNEEPIALFEAKTIGFAPQAIFDRPIKTAAQAKQLTAALADVVKTLLAESDKAPFFDGTDTDGINTPLYQLMASKLAPLMKGSSGNNHLPYRPNDKFDYKDPVTGEITQYTPIEFMEKILKFNPDDYVMVTTTEENKELVYEAIHDSLTASIPIPILMGFAVFNQKLGEEQMVWSEDTLTGSVPATLDGGHEVLILNGKINGVEVVGHIFLNSWGFQGFDVNGRPSKDPTVTGFNGITIKYHNLALQQKEASEFVFPKSFLQQAKYAALLKGSLGPTPNEDASGRRYRASAP